MKNIKRLFLLVALIVIAAKVFSSDFKKANSQKNTEITIVNN